MTATPATALLDAYGLTLGRHSRAAADAVARAWWTFGNVDGPAAARFGGAAARLGLSTRVTTANLTAAYLARQVALLAGVDPDAPVVIDPADLATPVLRSGVTDENLWARPVARTRGVLAEGEWWSVAMRHGEAAAREVIVTDIALAQRTATRRSLTASGLVAGYRRVLTGRNCKLCTAAADRVYHKADLMPIHTNCDCRVSAVVGAADPGGARNRAVIDLRAVEPATVAVDLTTEIAPSLQEV